MNKDEDAKLREDTVDLMFTWNRRRTPRLSSESADGFYDAIQAAAIIASEADSNVTRWVHAGLRSGLSWQEIGDALGISRQAAFRKFATKNVEHSPTDPEDGFTIRTSENKFGEHRMLRDQGYAKSELVKVRPDGLMFRSDTKEWEYRRVLEKHAFPSDGDGWSLVGRIPPFSYYKRPIKQNSQGD